MEEVAVKFKLVLLRSDFSEVAVEVGLSRSLLDEERRMTTSARTITTIRNTPPFPTPPAPVEEVMSLVLRKILIIEM